jgi:hypothetical protein
LQCDDVRQHWALLKAGNHLSPAENVALDGAVWHYCGVGVLSGEKRWRNMVVGGRYLALAGVVALGACAVPPPPAAPSVMAMPGQGKGYGQFQNDDGMCRQAASASIGGVSPAQAANNAGVGSAVVGTLLGAAAGALIGSAGGAAGAGAAIGAGAGLVAGSSVGAANAQAAGGSLQWRYDATYAQCMTAQGEQVAGPPLPYGYPYPPPAPPPGYYGPPAGSQYP